MKPDPDEKAWLDAEAAWLGPESKAVDAERGEIRTAKDALDKASALIRRKSDATDRLRRQLDKDYAKLDRADPAWTSRVQLYLDQSAVWQAQCDACNEAWAAHNRQMAALLARTDAMIEREDAWKERFAAYVDRRDAWYTQRDKALTEEGLRFDFIFNGHPIVIANTIKGACFATSEIADILGCDPTALASVPGIFLDDVLTKSMRHGARGAQLRKWLKKTIRLSKERIHDHIIEQGLMVYDLTPITSSDGTLIRLKEQAMFTPKGMEAARLVVERDGAVVH
jgi:hypothetical protein